ncbi:MAG TPA: HlyD family efflux transporter periplasmic adaptor subunit [Syntrophomonadaceae bacterium]|nr:HlyD family efflux transporter periplasmic adaptor subunit [Syntrophomonadaceae bacterium]HPR93341.1 HlyD family efflux transporter periplasmic adaptor subunit [Syntrophomonadaceae bacterium]
MKRLVPAICFILLTVLISGCSADKNIELNGVAETSLISHYSEVTGKITVMPLELGQEIKAGDVIAVIDDSNEKYALEQLEAVAAKKQAMMKELLEGIDAEQVRQGENNVLLAEKALESAQLTNDLVQNEYQKAQKLFAAGGLSETARTEAEYKAEQSAIDITVKQTQLDNARQQLAILYKGATKAQIDALQAEIDQTNSQINQVKDNLTKYKITALSDGTVISRNYLLGNMVAPGYNIADIASKADKYLLAYLPEEYLPDISYGQEVIIKSGNEDYRGVINYIDSKAQYTPKDMQTAANKNKDTVKIKVKLDRDNPLKIGEKATLVLEK